MKSSKNEFSGAANTQKYRLTDKTVQIDGRTLYQIQALRNIPEHHVEEGDLGGFIEHKRNLSQKGDAWVCDGLYPALVYGDARVSGDALIGACAYVYGNAKVYGNAEVKDSAKVYGNAEVYGNARVEDRAKIYGNAKVCDYAVVSDEGEVKDSAIAYGEARVYYNEVLSDKMKLDM